MEVFCSFGHFRSDLVIIPNQVFIISHPMPLYTCKFLVEGVQSHSLGGTNSPGYPKLSYNIRL